jgi:hypothetical protein
LMRDANGNGAIDSGDVQLDLKTYASSLTVQGPPNSLPTISRLAPSGSSVTVTRGVQTSFSVSVADVDGDLANVEWFVGSGSMAWHSVSGSSATDSWTYTFNAVGSYVVFAYVYDADKQPTNVSTSWGVTVNEPPPAQPPTITSAGASPNAVSPGGTITITYGVSNPGSATPILLGASIRASGGPTLSDPTNDKKVTISYGSSSVSRSFVVPTTATAGTYDLLVSLMRDANGNGAIDSGDVQLDLKTYASSLTVQGPLDAPRLLSPGDGTSGEPTTPTLQWQSVLGANKYWLTVATSAAALPTDPNATTCSQCAYQKYTTATEWKLPVTLAPGTTYFWRVQGYNNSVAPVTQGQFSAIWWFRTSP